MSSHNVVILTKIKVELGCENLFNLQNHFLPYFLHYNAANLSVQADKKRFVDNWNLEFYARLSKSDIERVDNLIVFTLILYFSNCD